MSAERVVVESRFSRIVPSVVRSVVASADLRYLQLGWAAAITGEQVVVVALGVAVYRQVGVGAVGIVGAIPVAAGALVSPVVGVLADRFRRERVMVAAEGLRVIALAGAGVAVWFAVTPLVYACAAVFGVGVALYYPARSALFPLLSRSTRDLMAVTLTTTAIQNLGSVIGPLLAAALLALSLPLPLFSAVVLFALAGIAASRISDTATLRLAPSVTSAREAIAEGFRSAAHEPGIRLALSLFAVQGLLRGLLNVLVVLVPLQLLHLTRGSVGYFAALLGLGGLVTMAAGRVLVGRSDLGRLMALALVAAGVSLVLLGVETSLAGAAFCLIAIGLAMALSDACGYALLARCTADQVQARVLALLELVWSAAVAAAAVLAGLAFRDLGGSSTLVIFGCLLALLPLALIGKATILDRSLVVPRAHLVALQAASSLAWLQPITLERLAARAETVHVPAGQAVVRQGERADSVYLLASGRVVVDRNGTIIDRLGPGQVFGEIGPLGQRPRTATVTTITACELLRIDGPAFVTAITGHPTALATTTKLLDERMERVRASSDHGTNAD